MRVGDSITITNLCAGEGFLYKPGQTVIATEENLDRLDSLVIGGSAEEERPATWTPKTNRDVDGRERVLVFVPMAPRLEPETVASVLAQEGVDYFDVMFAHDNPYLWPGSERMKNIQVNFEKARRVALSEGYRKLWIVESDVIVPKTALKNLISVDASVVSGLYLMRRGSNAPNVFSASGPVLNHRDVQDHWGEVIPMAGGCTGCLLVDTAVLNSFSFLTGERRAPDSDFMAYCRSHQVKQMAHLGVVCGHKRPDGVILWPDRESGVRKAA